MGNTIKFKEVTLGLIPKVLDAVDVVFTGGKSLEWLIRRWLKPAMSKAW